MGVSLSEAKRIVNALKSGVIPETDLELLSIGRDREKWEFQRCLDDILDGNGCVKFVSGEYGSGKTFMLNVVQQLAAHQNFVTSRLQINKGFYLNNLDNLYYQIMHNLAIRAGQVSGSDFEDIFDRWIENLRSSPEREKAAAEIKEVVSTLNNYNSAFSRAFLTYVRARIGKDTELSNAAASWIKGEKNIPAALKARFDVKGDVDKLVSMDFLKAFCKLTTLMGYSGTVILVDELELVMTVRSDLRRSCYENLRYLIDACYAGEFRNCLFVFAGTREILEDEEKGIKTYHALFQRLGDAIAKSNSSVTDIRQPVMRMGKLSMDELQLLTDKVVLYHRTAYGWEPKISHEAIRNWTLLSMSKSRVGIPSANTREFVTKLIEVLDIMEQNPGYNIFNTELKVVNKNGMDTFVNTFAKPVQDSNT